MREVRKKSAAPIYVFAGVWLLYCLFCPLYKLWHFILLICVSIVAMEVSKKLFPDKVEYVEELEPEPEPFTTGNAEHDALLKEGEMAVSELARLRDSIRDASVKAKTETLRGLTDRIFKDIIDDPSDYRAVRRFADYFLPTTLKLLNEYDRMEDTGISDGNIGGTLSRIEGILDTTIEAYRKQLDALFENQALDIDTDITVLESMLKKEGLSGKDFN